MAGETKSTTKLVVFCKLPSGIAFPLSNGEQLVLKGWHHPGAIGAADGSGHGVTYGVDPDAWADVKKRYASHPVIANEVAFAQDQAKADEGAEKAQEHTDRVGLEPINPAADASKDDGKNIEA